MRTIAQASVNGSYEHVEEEIDVGTPGQVTALTGALEHRAGRRPMPLPDDFDDAIDLGVSALGDEPPDHTASHAARPHGRGGHERGVQITLEAAGLDRRR